MMDIKENLNKIKATLKGFKGLSVIFLPDYGNTAAKTYKFGIYQVIGILAFYAAVSGILGFLILGITPLRDAIFPGSGLSQSDVTKIKELNSKLNQVTMELEHLKDTNDRLKFAIGLGDSTLLKSLEKNKDTIKTKRKKSPFGGNIFVIIEELFQEKQDKQPKSYYFSKPADSFISRGFDPDRGHMGIDFVIKTGTPVFAAANGYVIFADYTTKDGYMMILDHNNGYISIYKHCSVLLKRARETVLQGETIALSGNTGEISTGPHLHFEIWKDGEPVDPKTVLLNY
jgi:murein DD-endopeptidase MepM/ murein hydrolase activator NlpD